MSPSVKGFVAGLIVSTALIGFAAWQFGWTEYVWTR